MSARLPAHKILVVDDETASIQALGDSLREEAKITFVTSGEDALMIAKANRPDLIMLDVAMPGMDGFAVCGRLKSDPQTKGIPIIFIAASDDEREQVRGFELGALDYVVKPLDSRIVIAKVRSLLAHLSMVPATDSDLGRRRAVDADRRAADADRRGVDAGKAVDKGRQAEARGWRLLLTRRLSGRAVKIAAVAGLLLFAGIGYVKYFKAPSAPPGVPLAKLDAPAKASLPVKLVAPDRAAPSDWVKTTSCGTIPKVSWWGTLTHQSMVEYVNQKHGGDWAPYIAKWEQQLVLMKDILSRDGVAKTKDGARLQGKELEAHIGDLRKRVAVAVCLAGEAAAARARQD